MFVRRAARTVRGFLKRGSERAERGALLKRATAAVVEAMEGRVLLTCDGTGSGTPTFDTPSAVLALPDGDTLIAGSTFTSAGNRTAFARYNADGTLDAAFDGDGKLVLDNLALTIHTMALSGGKIVAGGSSAGNKFAVMRFDLTASSVALDPTFDGDGVAEVLTPDASWPDGFATGAAMAVEVKGTHLVASGHLNGGRDYLVARFNALDGSPDLLFGLPAPEMPDQNGDLIPDKLGYVTTSVGTSNAAGGMAVYDDGRILTIGTSDRAGTMTTPARDGVFTLIRYLPDGTLDPDFGSNGVVMQAFSASESSADVGQSVHIVGDKIIAVGTADRSLFVTAAIGIARFHDVNGALDTTFGTNGLVHDYIDGEAGAVAIEVKGAAHQSDGSIVVAGEIFDAFNGFPKDVALAKFGATGARDSSFDNSPWPGGAVVGDAGGTNERVVGMAVDSGGNFVVGAQGGPQDGDFSLLRFASAGSFTGVTNADFGVSSGASASIVATPGPHLEGSLVELQNLCGTSGAWSVTRDGVSYAGGAGAAFSFTPDDDGEYVVTLDVGGGVTDAATITAADVLPTVSLGPDLFADEGAAADFDPDLGSSFAAELAFAWTVWQGDQQVGTASSGSTFAFVPSDDGVYEVRVLVTDDDGNAASGSVLLTANNVAPTLAPAADQTVNENGAVTVEAGAVTDPGADAHATQWELRDAGGVLVNSGDGSAVTLVLADDGEYTLTFVVTDNDGGEGTDSVLLRALNTAPLVDAGADVNGAVEGTPVGVTMAGAADVPADTIVAVAWQVKRGGATVASGTGATALFTPADDGIYEVTFSATDDDGGVGSDSLHVTVANARPVATINSALIGVRQWEVALTGSFTDAGTADTHASSWRVTDAAGLLVASGSGGNIRFTPDTAGFHTVTYTVTDDDGGVGSAQEQVDVRVALVVGTVLRVGGSSEPDAIVIRPGAADTDVQVLFDGVSAGIFTPARTLVRAGRGADSVKVVTGLTRPTTVNGGTGGDTLRSGNTGDVLFGDNGNDSVLGSGGSDVLVGGDGNDLLVGGKGDDLLIGGLGADSLVGNSDDDVIVGGWTLHDEDPAALADILRTWRNRIDYQSGVKALRTADGLLADQTVFDDGARDVITGDSGRDVFYGNFDKPGILDVITDLKASEFEADLDLITPLET